MQVNRSMQVKRRIPVRRAMELPCPRFLPRTPKMRGEPVEVSVLQPPGR